MPIADIEDKILKDAIKKAGCIVDEAKNEARKINSEAEDLKKEILKEGADSLKKIIAENEKRVVSAANQEVQLLIAKNKRKMLDEVFDTALQKLLSLSDAEYKKMLKKILEKTVGITDEKIFAPKEKVSVTEEVLKEMGLKNAVIPTSKFGGGIIAVGKNHEYNLTFENILADKKNSLEASVAKILFKE